MPFQSDKQRRWMYANKPAMAKRWQEEGKTAKKKATLKVLKEDNDGTDRHKRS